ncbi:MAG: response regulator [Acidobacteriota bacterium]|nr:response regulator [Acidobacteriota bacterium]
MTATVLVAEDDEDILLLVTTRLQRDGYDVVTARSGAEALELVRERRPALAVLDIGMPPPDGLEVVRQIRGDAELRAMRLLLLTAKAQESDVRRGLEAGADAYLSKPFSPADLSARVRALL